MEIKDVGTKVKTEVKEPTLEEKKKIYTLAIFKQSDEAIQVADKMLRGFEIKLENEETRAQITGPTGVVLGTSVNMLLDSAVEENPDTKAHKREVGLTSLAEVGVGMLKTLFAGNRKRIAEGKMILKKK